ncbi:MAG: xanthine dehydrogenase family protein molybdopterin-binding subunit, partial [Gammaproteobacteria bacterium]|nr:xanthine dehydrogenase family protein molybdopterin-binding subunit [Gammaproteobacteria bacterium]
MAGKVDGTTVFGSDVQVDGMLMASVEHPPTFGGSVASLDDSRARRVDGVVDVVRIPQGVAVVARNTFAALEGRNALRVDWDP